MHYNQIKLFLFLALVTLAAAVPAELDTTNAEEGQDETSVVLAEEVLDDSEITTEDYQDETSSGLEAEESAEMDVTSTEDLQDETDVSSDRSGLLVRRQFIAYAAPNTIHVLNYTWRGWPSTRITSWRVLRVGAPQGGFVTRTGGGVNTNVLSMRFQSAKGRGFNYILEIRGR